jgi:tetratricopeptide (TPR) repeat protein
VVGVLFAAVITSIYFVSGSVFIRAPDPSQEIEFPNPGVQDEYIGIDTFSVNDSSALICQSLSLVREGDLTVTPLEGHYLFDWSVSGIEKAGAFTLPAVDDRLRDWIRAGTLTPARRYPQIVATQKPGVFINCFGIGGSVTAAPVFALAELIVGRMDRRSDLVDRLAFMKGSLLVAASAFLLFLIFVRDVPVSVALLLAGAYALGTCVFSTSSQGLWQHGGTAIYLGIGLWILSRPTRGRFDGYLLGLALSLATLSRPTMGVVAAAVGVQLALSDRRTFVRYAVTGLPFAILLFGMNTYFFGSPLTFGQTVLVDHAMEKTGVAKIWQTPTLTGLTGLLWSPSRGLFVFSPFLLAAIPGMWVAWREPRWRWMRGPSLALVGLILIECHHFDWWGGWSFGYRHLVDLSPIMVTLILPIVGRMMNDVRLRSIFLFAVAWSVGVQIVGVSANDLWRWNGPVHFSLKDREGKEVGQTRSFAEFERWTSQPGQTGEPVVRNVDFRPYRYRLWSWKEQPVLFYLSNFRQSMWSRQGQMWNARRPYSRKLAVSYHHVADAYLKANALSQATSAIEWSLEADPSYQEGLLAAWQIMVQSSGQIDRFLSLLRRQCVRSPDDQAARIYLGWAFVERGNLLDANDAFEDVIRRDWRGFLRRFEWSRAVMVRRTQSGRMARPANLVKADMARIEKIVDVQVRARRLELDGKHSEAQEAYASLAALMPGSTSVESHQARIHWEEGDRSAAEKMLRGGAGEREE